MRAALSRIGVAILGALLASGCAPPADGNARDAPAAARARTEILWDSWGIPHVFAPTAEELFRAFGWAQAHAHGDLLLRLYGESRGRAAEYWGGSSNAQADRLLRTMGVPGRAREWYQAQSPELRGYLDAFADGINRYAAAHPERIVDSVHVVLPVVGADVLAHVQRVVHLTFAAQPWRFEPLVREASGTGGSNAWAVAPQRSASGHALLLANPHLPWSDMFTLFEAQLQAPGVNAYGATFVGLPVLGFAFNEHLGWTHTVSTAEVADLYELRLTAGGYEWDGAVRALTVRPDTLRIRRSDGTVRLERFIVHESVHGPLVTGSGDRAYALRVAGLDQPHLFEQYWQMIRARDRAEFEAALSRLQMPFFNVVYADRAGDILYVFNARVPVRRFGDWQYWRGIVRGDASATLWTEIHPYEALPRLLNPPSGWLQNANDPPWTATLPMRLDRTAFPAYLSSQGMGLRPQRSARLLAEHERIGLDDMIRLKHSTRSELADRVLDELVAAARARGGPAARRAAAVLETWDRATDAESRGAVLFGAWTEEVLSGVTHLDAIFALPWNPASPLAGPRGLRDPGRAAAALDSAALRVERTHGALDVPWGDVYRLRSGTLDLPANGGPDLLGIFRITEYAPGGDGRYVAASGDSFVAAIEFSSPVRALAVLAYGNASQPHSPHRGDQLRLYAAKELRPVWTTRAEIEANLSARTGF